ncbi:MAG: YbhB/YbcL family Raf kinase inhibitor-like protein [Candidatus Altiarchaeota archaeon]
MKRLLLAAVIFLAGCISQENQISEVKQMGELELSSSAFSEGETIPSKYTCDGDDINPPLKIAGAPDGAESLVLIMDDPDAPMGTWDHWVLFNINPKTDSIPEDTIPEGAFQGVNSWGKTEYGGPCPPSGTHRYFFKLYALDNSIPVEEIPDKKMIEASIKGHILAQTRLMGKYQRK